VIRFSKALFALMANLSCVGAESGVTQAKARILVLNMRLSAGQHQVLSARVVDSPVALKQPRVQGDAIRYSITDEHDAPLMVASMRDPRVLRGPMPAAGQGETGHSASLLDAVDYILRVPYSSNARYLKFLPAQAITQPAAPTNSSSGNSNSSAVADDGASQVIDLQQFLPRN
jgi:hypothetical protein